MGLVKIEVIYNSPDVTATDGKDRGGKIWGQLIKDGMTEERWMESKGEPTTLKPYRMGANENTIIKVSHDILVEGFLVFLIKTNGRLFFQAKRIHGAITFIIKIKMLYE